MQLLKENNSDMETLDKVGRYEFMAEPFHCDFSHRLFMGHLGNHLLNAADYHSTERNFGMSFLNTINKTWVLSRLAIETTAMPVQYERFTVETWVESAMRYFTNRNFRIASADGQTVYGYGRSVWAMIDTETRQPQNIFAVRDGKIGDWIEPDKPCNINKCTRVKISSEARLVRTIDTYYNDVDVNGHINSVKYIEHILDLFGLDWYRSHDIHRFEIAYVAESHQGDCLSFYMEQTEPIDYNIRITKTEKGCTENIEVCRSRIMFVEK